MAVKNIIKTKALVLGMGLADCATALESANEGIEVLLINQGEKQEYDNNWLPKKPATSSSEKLAGGLNSVSPQSIKLYGDSIEKLVEETMNAGEHLNCRSVVEYCAEHFYPDVIQWFEKLGAEFDSGLHNEGSKTVSRVHHISDHTGRDLMRLLHEKVRNHKNITVLDKHVAYDLITENWINNMRKEFDICRGAYVYDIENKREIAIEAEGTFVALGSIGAMFPATSAPQTATGAGIAMAYRSYLPLVLMEMIQYHPTGLATPSFGTKPLCTQGLRGAGAYIMMDPNGNSDFMKDEGFDTERGSNAERAPVSIGMAKMADRLGFSSPRGWLNATVIAHLLESEFSDFYTSCNNELKMDPRKVPVPIQPLVHYLNGGVLVGKHGETLYGPEKGIARLYFTGENACTGVDGADRFPSNSGPAAVLFGRLAAQHFMENKHPESKAEVPLWDRRLATEYMDATISKGHIAQLQDTMGRYCGIIRTASKLAEGLATVKYLHSRNHGFYRDFLVDEHSLTARNMLDAALPIILSANFRESSIGGHFRKDFPDHNPQHNMWTVVQKGREPIYMPIPK